MTKDEVITHLRYSDISNEALKETPKQDSKLDPFDGAPEWARFRVADLYRKEFWASERPYPTDYGSWYGENCMFDECPDRRLTYSDWRESLVERGKP